MTNPVTRAVRESYATKRLKLGQGREAARALRTFVDTGEAGDQVDGGDLL
jgi:hypothetical protein